MTAQDIILAPGSVPFVPPGVEIDGETVYTSDEGLRLEHVPEYCAIIGSGIIGLEFSDVYTALGAECTLIEALPILMPAFDREIAKQAERLLLTPRGIDYRTGVFASKVTAGKLGEKPVVIEIHDFDLALKGVQPATDETRVGMASTAREQHFEEIRFVEQLVRGDA